MVARTKNYIRQSITLLDRCIAELKLLRIRLQQSLDTTLSDSPQALKSKEKKP